MNYLENESMVSEWNFVKIRSDVKNKEIPRKLKDKVNRFFF